MLTSASRLAGYGNMLGAGGFRNGVDDARLKGQLSYSSSSRQGSVMSQISEMGSEELGGSNGATAARSYSGIPAGGAGYAMDGWDDAPDQSHRSGGVKWPRNDPAHLHLGPPSGGNGKTSADMAAIDKFLQFQDAVVPCKTRAKRGCATHPRSIAERVRTPSPRAPAARSSSLS
jgi:hypothetical protein